LPVRFQPALRKVPLPVNTASVVHDVTTGSCASDRQVSPVSAPPAQRSAPSVMPSSESQAARTREVSSAVFAVLNAPSGAASALAVRLNAPMNPTQL
jgi:hypothetical protein